MLNQTVTCDACGHDLTETPFGRDWLIAVSVESMPADGDVVFDVSIKRPLPAGPYHFCSLGCLTTWCNSSSPSQKDAA